MIRIMRCHSFVLLLVVFFISIQILISYECNKDFSVWDKSQIELNCTKFNGCLNEGIRDSIIFNTSLRSIPCGFMINTELNDIRNEMKSYSRKHCLIIVYTVITDAFGILPQTPQDVNDFTCYIAIIDLITASYNSSYQQNRNQDPLYYPHWEVFIIKKMPYKNPGHSCRAIKLLGLELFSNAKWILYHDAKVQLYQNAMKIISLMSIKMGNNTFIAIEKHFKRDRNLEEELSANIIHMKNKISNNYVMEDINDLQRIHKQYTSEQYYDKVINLCPYNDTCMVDTHFLLIRNNPCTRKYFCTFANEVSLYTHRDQVIEFYIRYRLDMISLVYTYYLEDISKDIILYQDVGHFKPIEVFHMNIEYPNSITSTTSSSSSSSSKMTQKEEIILIGYDLNIYQTYQEIINITYNYCEISLSINKSSFEYLLKKNFIKLLTHRLAYVFDYNKIIQSYPRYSFIIYHKENPNILSIPISKYPNVLIYEVERLFNSSYVDILLLEREINIHNLLINHSLLINASRICFIHSTILEDNNYHILSDLLDHLLKSNLIFQLDVVIILNYGIEISNSFKDNYSNVGNNILWLQVYHNVAYFEIPTIRILHQLSRHLYETMTIDTHVVYLYTKGTSYIHSINSYIDSWRYIMLYHLVQQHMKAYHLLHSNEFNTVGLLYSKHPSSNYQGNYWWSKISYLSKLPLLEYHLSGKYEPRFWLLNDTSTNRYYDIYIQKEFKLIYNSNW